MRAEPPIQAEPMPAIEILSITAKGATIHATPTLPAIWLTPCTIPCNTLMSFLPIATSSVSVAPMYSTPETTPPHATAPGSVSCGSRISSPITEASSSPTSPKQITPNEFSTNLGLAGMLKSAAATGVPQRDQTVIPKPLKTGPAIKGPVAPKLVSHFPTPRTTKFSSVTNANRGTQAYIPHM